MRLLMDRIGVIYATMTKHSKKLAEAIGQAVGAKAENIAANPKPYPADLLFIVGGIYAGKSSPELVKFVETIEASQVKQVVLVTSSASVSKRSQADIRKILNDKGIKVVDELTCPGGFLFVRFGHPNAADVQAVTAQAKRIAGTP